jgi:pentatricopeptide repeat protein
VSYSWKQNASMAQWIQWHVTLLIDGVGKAGELGLACGLLNRMNKKHGVPAPRTWKGR